MAFSCSFPLLLIWRSFSHTKNTSAVDWYQPFIRVPDRDITPDQHYHRLGRPKEYPNKRVNMSSLIEHLDSSIGEVTPGMLAEKTSFTG